MDTPIEEDNKSLMCRTWLCFISVSAITWPFSNARLPAGCWLTSPMEARSVSPGFQQYEFSALMPEFGEGENVNNYED
jgi:hypothetical protein